MRLMEQSDELRMRFPHLPLPVWLFHHTPLLLFLLPLSWGAIACLRAENAGRLMLVQPWDGRLGLGLTAVLTFLSFYAAALALGMATTPVSSHLLP